MRTSMVVTILAMGALAVLLTSLTAEIYRNLSLDTERAALTDHLRVETARRRSDFDTQIRVLWRLVDEDAVLEQALRARQTVLLNRRLSELHHDFIEAAGAPPQSVIYVFDAKGVLIASSLLARNASIPLPPCYELVGAPQERGRTPVRTCYAEHTAYLAAAFALSSRAGGYLYIASELVPSLVHTERQFGMPLRVRDREGETLYQSARWPRADEMPAHAVATYTMNVQLPSVTPLYIDVAKDMSGFLQRLKNLRYLVFGGVAVAVTIAMLIALLALEKYALRPLRALTVQLRRILHDKRSLGEQVDVHGNAEVVELAAGFNEMTTRLRQSYENLERMAFTDALTALPNRSLFRDRLQQAIVAARRDNKTFALFIMDLDRFKDINDTLGHHTGDALLVQVAQRLRGKLRASDTVARLGGDEFAILLPAVDVKHAGMAARMLLQALRAPFNVEDQNLSIGASIGIVLYPEHGVDANVLMQRADVAMYAAKEEGSGYMFYRSAIDQNMPTRLAMLADLREALEQEQFELFYQPIVGLANDRVVGVEALVRWRHPSNGILLPDSFIPLLEQSGLIRSLMPWVLNEALTCLHRLQESGFALGVSVNLSMRDLQDPYIVDNIMEHVASNNVDPRLITLEITESVVMTDAPRALELLSQLAAKGLRIAVDDFGTGYSSLAYLKRLPVHTLKVDKSFVTGMNGNDSETTIVRTSIELAHNLGLSVVAEGVETESALRQLKVLGCDMAQGHYIGRPLDANELRQWLEQSSWGFRDSVRLYPPAAS